VFVAEVHKDQQIYLEDPDPRVSERKSSRGRKPTLAQAQSAGQRVDAWAAAQPAELWQKVTVRAGTKGEIRVEALRAAFSFYGEPCGCSNKSSRLPAKRLRACVGTDSVWVGARACAFRADSLPEGLIHRAGLQSQSWRLSSTARFRLGRRDRVKLTGLFEHPPTSIAGPETAHFSWWQRRGGLRCLHDRAQPGPASAAIPSPALTGRVQAPPLPPSPCQTFSPAARAAAM
jgi:hypothetical protein